MAQLKQPIIIGGFETEQNQRICLADEDGKHFFCLYNILYAKGDGCYTTFYMVDSRKPDEIKAITTCHNLGYYKMLLRFGFGQANQRIVFNLVYLDCITKSNEVVLKYKHELIQVTPTYRDELYEMLKIDVG